MFSSSHAFALVAILLLSGCSKDDTGGPDCSAAIAGTGSRHDGLCYRAANCKWDEACVAGRCTTQCTVADDCRRHRGCIAGKCGRCTEDTHCDAGDGCVKGYCLTKTMPVWKLTMDPKDWTDLRSDNRYKKTEYPCSLSVAGKSYPGCTVRARGQSSLDYKKIPLRIKFAEDAAHPGYSRKINLRSEYNDRSYLRLVLANETFRHLTNIPTPRTRFVRLEVNGSDRGIFVEYERIAGKFLERHRRDRNSAMYEADPSTREYFQKGIASLVPLPASLYKEGFQKKTGLPEDDFSDLAALVEKTLAPDYSEATSCRTREAVNLELFMDYLAVMGLVQSKDHARKNFYTSLQKDAQGKTRWEFYPWDLDLTFGCLYTDKDLTLCEAVSHQTEHTYGTMPAGYAAAYPLERVGNVAIGVVYEDPQLKKGVEQRLCTMLGSAFWTKHIVDLIAAYQQVLLPEVRTDTHDRNGTYGADDPAGSETAFEADIAGLLDFVQKRATYLRQALGCG